MHGFRSWASLNGKMVETTHEDDLQYGPRLHTDPLTEEERAQLDLAGQRAVARLQANPTGSVNMTNEQAVCEIVEVIKARLLLAAATGASFTVISDDDQILGNTESDIIQPMHYRGRGNSRIVIEIARPEVSQ